MFLRNINIRIKIIHRDNGESRFTNYSTSKWPNWNQCYHHKVNK